MTHTHRSFLSALDRDTRAALTRRSDPRGLLHLCGHLALILGFGTWIALRLPGWPLLLIPQGIVLIFLFTLEHETVHETPFASRWLNRCIGTVCGVVILVPYTWFRYFHLAHHKHTNDPANDPELEAGKPSTRFGYVWHVSGLPTWRAMVVLLLRQALSQAEDRFLPAARRGRVIREARVMLAFYTLVAGLLLAGWSTLLWVWLVPVLVGQPFLRLYLLAEHGRCPPVADMFENTRTTYTGAAIRFIAWNMPYHAEHHTYPAVPFWQLPGLNRLIRDHLKSTSPGYVAFHRDLIGDLGRGPKP